MPTEAEIIQTLKRKRAALKSRLTIFKNHVEEADTDANPLDEAAVIELEERLAKISSLSDEFEQVQIEIDVLQDDEAAGFEERRKFDSSFYSTIAAAKKLLIKVRKSEAISSASSNSNAESTLHGIKLPTIQLPKFNGNYEFWLEFRDTYQSLIHENSGITDIQKYHYLRSALTGSAVQVIQSLEFSSANYSVAWDILRKRFDNTKLLVHNHVKAIFNLEVIAKESAVKMRKIIDDILKHLRALSILNQPTAKWDTLIIHIICTKLDKVTVRYWEEQKCDNEIPSLNHLIDFLRARADLLETLSDSSNSDKATENKSKSNIRSFIAVKETCVFCKGEHRPRDCNEVSKLTPQQRQELVLGARLCLNCLKAGHFNRACKASSCKKCRAKHHTLLHLERTIVPVSAATAVPAPVVAAAEAAAGPSNVALSSFTILSHQVLLSTARVLVYGVEGKAHRVRALLDSASQSSFITTQLCKDLNLKAQPVKLSVAGLSQLTSHSDSKCTLRIFSHRGPFVANLSCFLLPQITGNLPNFKVDVTNLQIPENITLADPSFNEPGRIDLLIGADLFWTLIGIGRINLGENNPILQKTELGWIISGPIGTQQVNQVQCNLSTNLEMQIAKFWELEECATKNPWSPEEAACEAHFVKTTRRDTDGRFVVKIPLKDSPERLGDSMHRAKRRFYSLEKRLQVNPELRGDYIKFMAEYESLGHMSKITGIDTPQLCYYMPHHGVVRADSSTTRLRVVFDCSMPTDSGYSINDLQMVGPTIQNDLLSIILRFRKHAFVATADVAKMYRQVLVDPSQTSLQRILWRGDPQQSLNAYELKTVTYGTAAAAFLATRCLHQLAYDCQSSLPEISEIIKNDFYVDDMLTGADTEEALTRICKQVSHILKGGCFELRKWRANVPRVITNEISNANVSEGILDLGSRENAKTLGLCWSVQTDSLTYSINLSCEDKAITKRTILSTVAQIFDPLGLLSPVVIIAKTILQSLWENKLSWDETVPPHLYSKFLLFHNELDNLNSLEIPRHAICRNAVSVEMHGFSDASEAAYGGCVYLRSVNEDGDVFVRLLCAKSKVAPLKTITLPRLELCGALTLAKLANKARTSLNINLNQCIFWSDSTIVLGWLNTAPNLLKTFVANRISEIQALTSFGQWRHVPTKENPADLLSRGVKPSILKNLRFWWHGPQWLTQEQICWPLLNAIDNNELPELRLTVRSLSATQSYAIEISKYSDLNKLERIVAYCVRFKSNCLKGQRDRVIGPIDFGESKRALTCLIKIAQAESFSREINNLEGHVPLNSKSKLLCLNPFLDENNVLRVGGRLQNSNFSYDKRHPIILDTRSHLTKLIFEREHKRLLHPGAQMLLAALREQFWPISGRNLSRKVTRDCVRCFRANPKFANPLMGELPGSRVSPGFPFDTVGVDYGGPFQIKDRKGRGCKTSKCYVSLFICFVTKAVHIELVTALSKDAFILALRRFVARRGRPAHIYSDNGTNFIGAKNELNAFGKFLTDCGNELIEAVQNEGLTWHFIPAYSPHMGGLWESGIKSIKHHLKRVLNNALLTYEELHSVLVQIESVLNSRPLSPLSSDPNDPLPLTPSHFLLGRSLLSLPDEDLKDVPENRLLLFQRLQQIVQHFWTRWAKEYVSELQQRTKWKIQGPNITKGTLVIVKEDNVPPTKWVLGRVIKVHPGHDGVVRVITIKTVHGEIKRAVAKVCALPIYEGSEIGEN